LNTPEAPFCKKCRIPLSVAGHLEREQEITDLKGQMSKMQQGLKSVTEEVQIFYDRVKKEEQRRHKLDDILDKQPPGWAEPYLTTTELRGPLTPEVRKKIQGLIEQLQNGTLPPYEGEVDD
jgi:hypothetical protein